MSRGVSRVSQVLTDLAAWNDPPRLRWRHSRIDHERQCLCVHILFCRSVSCEFYDGMNGTASPSDSLSVPSTTIVTCNTGDTKRRSAWCLDLFGHAPYSELTLRSSKWRSMRLSSLFDHEID